MHKKTRGLIGAGIGVVGLGTAGVLVVRYLLRKRLAKPITVAITINAEPDEVYETWRAFERLPDFMRYLESVRVLDSRRSHWVAKSPVGTLEWDAEIDEEVPGRALAWRSVTKAMPMRGHATFQPAPGGRGTEMILELQVPTFAKLFTAPELHGDLRRFKQIVETGEITVSDASSVRGLHPGQPAPEGGVR